MSALQTSNNYGLKSCRLSTHVAVSVIVFHTHSMSATAPAVAVDLSPSPIAALHAAFAVLDQLAVGLAARVAGYVVDGSEPDVLLALPSHALDAGEMLGKPGRVRNHYREHYQPNARLALAAESALRARDSFYRTQSAQVAQLVRLGHVLAAADGGRSLERTGAQMPDWLHYLLNDALWATLPDSPGALEFDALAAARPAWDIRLLRALLADAGLPQSMALPIVFERSEVRDRYHKQIYRRLRGFGPLDEDLLQRRDDVDAAAGAMSAAGKMMLADRLGLSETARDSFAGLLVRLATAEGKTVRERAARHLASLERAGCVAALAAVLHDGRGEARLHAAALLASTRDSAAEAPLEAALARAPGAALQTAIRDALAAIRSASGAGAAELPAPPPLPAWQDTTLADDALDTLLANRDALLDELGRKAEDETQYNLTARHPHHRHNEHLARYRQLEPAQLRDAVRALNGESDAAPVLADENVVETIGYGHRITARPDFGLMQVMRWELRPRPWKVQPWFTTSLEDWMRRQGLDGVDLRSLSDAAVRCGAEPDMFARVCLIHYDLDPERPQAMLPPERVWPYLAQHPDLLDAALAPVQTTYDIGQAIAALATFPVLPARWVPRLMELALGESDTHRAAAQQALGRALDIGTRIAEALASNRQEARIQAARWLARLDHRAAIPALYAALDKETRETASAELMSALERLGEDLAPRLSPSLLLAQARKALKAKPPAGLAWLALDALPACRWAGAQHAEGAEHAAEHEVASDILRWWVVLAARLKEAGGNDLLRRYLGLLDTPSRAALGRFVLFGFMAHDTRRPALEEAIAYAAQHAPAEYRHYLRTSRKDPNDPGNKVIEARIFEHYKALKLAEYSGSAIGEKGILALAWGMPGHELADAIRAFMRDHHLRRAQIEALLEAAAVSDERSVIQLLLATARRHRTASVQQKARDLVERVAARNGWSADELADRTIPTGGLDEHGRLTFAYGARTFTVLLDEKLKPVLHNADGKPVAALPDPRQDDPPASIKEGKALLATCKKEIKQVVAQQEARLYEAMCAGRTWGASDWDEYLRRHPVAGRLAQRLAWAVLDADGAVARVFRPTEDGSLVDAGDDEVVLAPDARVKLAHASLLDAAQVHAWQAHFKDYKVTPLFAQLARPAPAVDAAMLAGDTIDDRLGWTGDTFTLRTAFGKLGYVRGATGERGVFRDYTRDFTGAGLRVRIAFSGSALPEEKVPAALTTLGFVRLGAPSGRAVALDQVPPVLLAEAWHDYHAVAAACRGFDPDWERKMPW